MPLNDCVKEVKEEIKKESKKDFNDIETINVKAESSLEIFSGYNYDTNEVLNQELAGYLVERAETIPLKSKLRIKIFTKTDVDEKEVENAYRSKFKKEFEDYDRKLKQNARFAFIMLLLGILFLGFLILEQYLIDEIVLSIILEIASWVFIWEAVDAYFLQRIQIREKRFQMARLYKAEFEIVEIDLNK